MPRAPNKIVAQSDHSPRGAMAGVRRYGHLALRRQMASKLCGLFYSLADCRVDRSVCGRVGSNRRSATVSAAGARSRPRGSTSRRFRIARDQIAAGRGRRGPMIKASGHFRLHQSFRCPRTLIMGVTAHRAGLNLRVQHRDQPPGRAPPGTAAPPAPPLAPVPPNPPAPPKPPAPPRAPGARVLAVEVGNAAVRSASTTD